MQVEVRFRKVPVQRFGCTYPAQVPEGSVQSLGEVPEGSVQIVDEVPEGSGADSEVRLRKVPVQRLGQVLEGSGAHAFRCSG